MTIDKVRELWKAEPFPKFVVHLADGRQIPVNHREFLVMSPSGRTVIVYRPDDSHHIIELLLVPTRQSGRTGRPAADSGSGPDRRAALRRTGLRPLLRRPPSLAVFLRRPLGGKRT